MPTQTAAEQITAAAAKLQWPQGYPSDLQVDLQNLADLEPQTFAWYVTAEYGTYLMLTVAVLEDVRPIAASRRGKLFVYQRGQLRAVRHWDAAAAALTAVPPAQRRPEFGRVY